MWKQQILDRAEEAARLFNNQKVFERIESHNSEFPDRLIIYKPIREYCNTRFLRALELYGPLRVPHLLNESLPNLRSTVTITSETHALALIIGIRETGMPLLGRPPQPDRSFTRPSGVYLRNFHGSGLDKIHMSSIQNRMARYLDSGSMNRIIIDDPTSTDTHLVGVRQDRIRTMFNVYLRQQNDTFLSDLNLSSMDRVARLFWRALTFGGQGGSSWEDSRAGGRISLKTLVINLLNIQPSKVKDLWDIDKLKRMLDDISDREVLKKIARHPTRNSRIHRRGSNDILGWRNIAIKEVEKGLGTPRYFQAIKAAAITEGILSCTTWPS